MFGHNCNAKIYGSYMAVIWQHIMDNFLLKMISVAQIDVKQQKNMTHSDLLGVWAFTQCVLWVGNGLKSGPWMHYAIQTSLTSVRRALLLLICAAAFFGC